MYFIIVVLSFLHTLYSCIISYMNAYKFIISIIISSIVSANSLTVDEILHKSLHRYDGVNHSFKLTSNKIGGKS